MIAKPCSLMCIALLLTSNPLFSQVPQSQSMPVAGYVQQVPPSLVIPDGTPVRLSLEEALNSANCEVGEAIRDEHVEIGSKKVRMQQDSGQRWAIRVRSHLRKEVPTERAPGTCRANPGFL